MADNRIAETIEREEEKKRFLEELKTARTGHALAMIAERIFGIETAQQRQNHNSSDMMGRVRRLEAMLLVLAVAALKIIVFGQAASISDIVSIVKTYLGIP